MSRRDGRVLVAKVIEPQGANEAVLPPFLPKRLAHRCVLLISFGLREFLDCAFPHEVWAPYTRLDGENLLVSLSGFLDFPVDGPGGEKPKFWMGLKDFYPALDPILAD